MDTQKIVTRFRLSGWGETMKERIASRQTVSAFCEEKGISKTTYYYRQKKVREAACTELREKQNCGTGLMPRGWTQLAEPELAAAAESALTIEISGCHIKVTASTDPELLTKVCRILGSL
jgi:putative transposase